MRERFSATMGPDPIWPGEVVHLRDEAASSWARLLPTPGCDLVSFGATLAGQPVETFLQPADEGTAAVPGHFGAPVLFPFPNRLRGGHATFEGRTIQIDRAPGQANAIHGLVRHLPWSVTRLGGAADAATVRCSVTADSPDLLRQFPFPFRLSLTFALRDATLRIGVTAENLGAVPMPCGFGWHPYFRLPLVPGGSRAAELIEVPARRQWVLDAAWLPTGETIPVPADRDFLTPRPLGDRYLDDVYTDVVRTDGASACTMQDPGSGVTVRLAAGPSFREWVVYAPPTRPTIAFEPYTCPTDAFNLAWRGIDAGVIVLPPGGRWEDWLELSVAA